MAKRGRKSLAEMAPAQRALILTRDMGIAMKVQERRSWFQEKTGWLLPHKPAKYESEFLRWRRIHVLRDWEKQQRCSIEKTANKLDRGLLLDGTKRSLAQWIEITSRKGPEPFARNAKEHLQRTEGHVHRMDAPIERKKVLSYMLEKGAFQVVGETFGLSGKRVEQIYRENRKYLATET